MTHHDVVVLGAGPGGYVAAIRAAQLGRSVAVVEAEYWGGVCLNIGCIPSKALLRNAELATTLRTDADLFGIGGTPTMDFGVAHDRSRAVANGRCDGVHHLMRKNRITEIDGRGVFTGPQSMNVRAADGSIRELTFDHAIVATGARPRMVPGVPSSERVMTYERHILERELPRRLVVVGAGAIGLEMAYVANAFGVEVTVLESLDRVLPREDASVSREMARAYTRAGVTIHTSMHVDAVVDDGADVAVTFSDASGATTTVHCDRVLVAVGFTPNVEDIGLDAAGVALDDRGAIAIDARTRTSAQHIHAVGDVTMTMQLAHVAEAQGMVAAETIGGARTMELGDPRMMPRAVFGHPQAAAFGLTEEQARAEHGEVRVVTVPFRANGKAHGMGSPEGFVTLIATAAHGTLLGAHLVGPDVSELLPELTLAQRWDLGAFELSRNVHGHPTLGEAVQDALHGLEGHLINL